MAATGPAWAATITVDSAVDNETSGDGLCTLREAVNNANADAQTTGGDCTAGSGTDTIAFDISGSSPIEIELAATLIFTDPVVLDGTTQPGNAGVCTTSIPDRPAYGLSLLGLGVTGGGANTAIRLNSGSDGSTIRGLNFQGFGFSTIIITTDDNLLECNSIGTTADGSAGATASAEGWGLQIGSIANNIFRYNLVSNKTIGFRFSANPGGNQVIGNFIGTDRAGTSAVSNDIGILVQGDNEVGSASQGNLISGNTLGVSLNGSEVMVIGNLIGTDVSGTSAVPNGVGVQISGDGNFLGIDASNRLNVISGNTGVGVEIIGADNELGVNYIGTDITGSFALPNGSHGIAITGSDNKVGLGGNASGSVISGNGGDGVYITDGDADGTRLWGNSIGTNVAETAAIPNAGNGVTVYVSSTDELTNLSIGNIRALGNVISGNAGHGIYVEDDDNTADTRPFILGNRIGTNRADTLDLGNGLDGIYLRNRVRGTTVGQFQSEGPTFTNTIAFNDGNGVTVTGGANNVSIEQNYIFENDGLGIDLADDGVTANDAGDGDGGPNRRQNFPDLLSASLDCAGDLSIEFFLDSSLASSNTHFIEFFLADVDGEEGAFFIGNVNYMSASSATAVLSAAADAGVAFGDRVIATAKSHLGDTSEFSASIPVTTSCLFEVTNTNDAGAGSLRQAILDANDQDGTTRIAFDIDGIGPHVISPQSALPAITGRTMIDGASQSGNEAVCTSALATRPDYQIVIDGAAAGRPDLLTLAAGSEGSIIQGLNLQGGNRAIVAQSGGHSILCNLIGTDASGTSAAGNTIGLALASTGSTVGGSGVGDVNAIAYNGTGIVASSGAGNDFRGNSFFLNTGLAIDLGADGSTANDAGDLDTGANLLQNSPELTRALVVDSDVQTSYTVASDPLAQAYPITVDFYAPDADGEEGETWLFSDVFETSDYPGDVVVTVTASTYGLESGDELVALATDANGNTSEFSVVLVIEDADCLNVTTTADSGTGSLREAITCANATSELDTITFAIPGAGPHVISPTTELPTIAAPVFIDGTTQTGNGTVCSLSIPDRPTYQVVLEDGGGIGTGIALGSGSDGSTIRGLNIREYGSQLIDIESSSGHTIACNFLGTDEGGSVRSGSSGPGVAVDGGSGITVGGVDVTQGNLIATRISSIGVVFNGGGSGNSVQHNFIGTDKAGTTALPNDIGVVISSTSGAYDDFAVLDNLISGNGTLGIAIGEIDGLEMKRNLIGTDLTGTLALGNQWQGVGVGFVNTIIGQTIGGTEPGEGNVIAFNGRDGITVGNNSQVAILGNSIFSNTQLGIDLDGGGANNDAGDSDTGSNNLQNYPVLTSAPTIDGGTLEIVYSVDSTTTNATYPIRVEFFMADVDDQEGMTYLGFDEYTASDYSGCGAAPCTKAADVALVGQVSDGDGVIATATDAQGNTSEFSSAVTAAVGCLTVTTTADSGTGSLREAIGCANAETGLDTITFAIDGDGPHVITLASDLPEIDDPVLIDGSSQPGNSTVCTAAIADRPDYGVVVDGGGVAAQIFELTSGADGSTIQGLNLRGTTTYGILATGSADGHTIRCNFIGTDESGLEAASTDIGVAAVSVADVTIGGSDPSDANLISGNATYGIWFIGGGSSGEVLGNYIGTDKTGAADLGNDTAGVYLQFSTGTAVIGGTADGEGNVIAYNGAGVVDATETTGHAVRGNSLFSNTGLGIDLGDDGATSNDAGDADSGANDLQNSPHLLDATTVDGMLSIGYQVDSTTANSAYPLAIDFYLADGDGEEGSEYIGSATYEAVDAQLSVRAAFPNLGSVAAGDLLVATATDASGNTSEFSVATEVNAFLVSTMADGDVGSLRQAIINANATEGGNWITFGITGGGPHVIAPASDLPAFTEPVIVDGTTQAGNGLVCTDAIADRGTYQIVLHGDADGSALLGDGLVLATGAAGSTIQGLNIRNFSGSGILLDASSDNAILCNFVGTDEEGAVALGNGVGLFVADADSTQIGGTHEGDGNLISGHTAGVSTFTGAGVLIAAGDADSTLIQGNILGTDKAGTEDLGNTVGLLTDSSGGSITSTVVGGTGAGEGNIVAFNGDGAIVGTGVSSVTIQGNSFYGNDTLGIDLQVGGVAGATANDAGDADDDANRGQNFPELDVDASTGDVVVTFSVDTETANATYPLTAEFFVADETNAQGEMALGTSVYTASDYSGCGVAPCVKTVNLGDAATLGVTAATQLVSTSTDTDGNTSEFSDAVPPAGLVDLAVSIVESVDPVTAGSGAGNLVYVATVTNTALVEATGVVLQSALTLPAGVTVVSQVSSVGSFVGTTWTLGTLAAGASATLTTTLTVSSAAEPGSDVIATSMAASAVNETDTESSNDTAAASTSIVRDLDLAVSLSEANSLSVVLVGGTLTYEVTASNVGATDATGVILSETVPENTTFNAAGSTADWQCLPGSDPGSICTFAVGDLASGGESTVVFAVTVDSPVSRDVLEILNEATVGTEGAKADSNPTDNTDALSIDVDLPPIVATVDTVSSTADGELIEGEGTRRPISQLFLEFSETVDGADDIDSFRLISSGADGLLHPTSCVLGPRGDDELVTIESIEYEAAAGSDGPKTRLGLGSGLPLQRGSYLLLACGDLIEDSVGQRLDGDAIGASGGNFAREFVVGESNLLENPNFEEDLAPWTSLDFDWDSQDVDGASSSGSAETLPLTEAVLTHPCVAVESAELGLHSTIAAMIDANGATVSVQLEVEFFDAVDCQGSSLGTEIAAMVSGDTGSDWFSSSVWTPLTDGAISARPRVRYLTTDSSSAAWVDRLTLIATPMTFDDGFESGGLDAWPDSP